jgi:aspartyl-tRNA(Asn)/glutamyl-tRNA(Gln) amidotransferase subunit A
VGPVPGVVESLRLLADGDLSAVELSTWCLDRIERFNPALNAFVHLDGEAALAAAARVDATPHAERGLLAGVPMGVKDLEDCAGMPTQKGSRWHAGSAPAAHDDLHVERLRRAGAVLVGKTAAPEFGSFAYTASPAFGVTRNPWDTERTPGGSSGGSSAAVACGLLPACTASDGGGSIRTPAAFTGLPGLKPMYGRIPTYGVTHVSQNAVVGSLATTVADTALLLDVMAGPDDRDRTCLPAWSGRYVDAIEHLDVTGLRATWSVDLGFAVVEPEVATICERAAERLIEAASLLHVDRPVRFDDYVLVYARIEQLDKFIGVDPSLWQERLDDLDPLVRPGWEAAAQVTLPVLARTYDRRAELEAQVAELFCDIDVLITPATAMPAFAAEGPMPTEIAGRKVHAGMSVVHEMLANVANLPAITIPVGVTAAGLPVGLQVIARRFREDVCLRLARIAELAMPWPRHAPMAAHT